MFDWPALACRLRYAGLAGLRRLHISAIGRSLPIHLEHRCDRSLKSKLGQAIPHQLARSAFLLSDTLKEAFVEAARVPLKRLQLSNRPTQETLWGAQDVSSR